MATQEIRRIAFTVQYDGAGYSGWQLQREHRTVQGDLEAVLARLFGRPVRILGSGRTDAGVHALGQVASVDAPARWSPADLARAMNALLGEGIWVSGAAAVAPDFHPRYHAVERVYRYRVGTSRWAESPFRAGWCWPLGYPLDRDVLLEETSRLLGDHSFARFAKAGQEERGDRCAVVRADWRDWEDLGVEFTVSANRFLHHMVRYLVGTLVEIARGRRARGDIERLLRGEPGIETSPPAPAKGLFLAAVHYPAGAYEPANGDSRNAPTEWTPGTTATRTR